MAACLPLSGRTEHSQVFGKEEAGRIAAHRPKVFNRKDLVIV